MKGGIAIRIITKYMARVAFILASILSISALALSIAVFTVNRTVLDPAFHQKLFAKHDIYSLAKTSLDSQLETAVTNSGFSSSEESVNQELLKAVITKSLQYDALKTNMDTLRDGIFAYFDGKTNFLPDIRLDMSEIGAKAAEASSSSVLSAPQALSRIDKINLGAILLYLNKSDITDLLSFIRLFYFISKHLPLLLLILPVLWLAFAPFGRRGVAGMYGRLRQLLLPTGILCSLWGILPLLLYKIFLAPDVPSVPFLTAKDNHTLQAYISDCIYPASLLLIAAGIIMISASAALRFTPKLQRQAAKRKPFIPEAIQALCKKSAFLQDGKLAKILYAAIIAILMLSFLMFEYQTIKHDFDVNGYHAILSKMAGEKMVTKVVSAENDTIYSLQLLLQAKEDEKPLEGIKVSVSGTSTLGNNISQLFVTDATGSIKTTLDKGTFLLSFLPDDFPEAYRVPSPLQVDLKSPGITMITLNAEPAVRTSPGIVEIQVLDANNAPVTGSQFEVSQLPQTMEGPNKMLSVTNAEGIAVFQLSEGRYTIAWVGSDSGMQYLPPTPLEVQSATDTVTRYTIRLVPTA